MNSFNSLYFVLAFFGECVLSGYTEDEGMKLAEGLDIKGPRVFKEGEVHAARKSNFKEIIEDGIVCTIVLKIEPAEERQFELDELYSCGKPLDLKQFQIGNYMQLQSITKTDGTFFAQLARNYFRDHIWNHKSITADFHQCSNLKFAAWWTITGTAEVEDGKDKGDDEKEIVVDQNENQDHSEGKGNKAGDEEDEDGIGGQPIDHEFSDDSDDQFFIYSIVISKK